MWTHFVISADNFRLPHSRAKPKAVEPTSEDERHRSTRSQCRTVIVQKTIQQRYADGNGGTLVDVLIANLVRDGMVTVKKQAAPEAETPAVAAESA